MISVPQIAKKYNLNAVTVWRVSKTIEPDMKVRRGSRYWRYYDEERFVEELRKRGYID